MPIVAFTGNLKRHIDCPPAQVDGETLTDVLQALFSNNQTLKSYVLDDQNRLRKHMNIAIDGEMICDRLDLSDKVRTDSEIFIFQALSGG